ncbi:type VI secretion system Vgr family protein [Mesorhizobium sp. 1B3]|uniref:type VI secretion system Vgr family protein n=1 Tax=Mesorhizobium sp. 1B3 TaxID=3243599 RepID=UPI003D96415C
MSQTIVQSERWITVESPLGEDVLVATEVDGVEGVSRLFEFNLAALSSSQTIKPEDLLGKSVTVSMARPGGARRYVNGIVISFAGGMVTRSDYRLFRLTLAPTLWTLGRASDHKVFQNKSAVDIVTEILKEHSVAYEQKLSGTYPSRAYCVQFGETDLAFVERLLAEEGIFYYFRHARGEHKLVLGDSANAYADCAQKEAYYRQDAEEATDGIHAMDFGAYLTDNKWVLRDYDFEAPGTPPEASKNTSLQPAGGKSWEHFAYPGRALTSSELGRLAGAEVDRSDAGFEVSTGKGTCASFTPGHRFSVKSHPVSELNDQRHVLSEVRHQAVDRAHFGIRAGMEGKPYYRNSFVCAPATRLLRPTRGLERPVARGPQTAIVVGPSGEEVHTDKYGRIRVQFHWDRHGNKDEKSSCYVHVAQSLAGSGWGSVFIPRVGMEVVVHFLDGDPDRPLVTGAVYNGQNLPPWAQSGTSTKTGLLTRSTKGGAAADANELSFEDKKDSEKILFHAQKDFVREVENDDALEVGNDQTRTIKKNRTTTIEEGNETLTIKQGNRVEKIEQGNETLDIDTGNRQVTISKGNESLAIKQGNRTVTLDSGNDSLTLSQGNLTITAQAGSVKLTAQTGITLECGSSSVEITQQGIAIKGLQLDLKADAAANMKGAMVEMAGQGMVTVKGGMVKIN